MNGHYDAIVIGTGQSGPSLAVRLAQAGHKTAVIERHRFGGTCVNTGCIPTKTLIASARVAYLAHRAAEFGIDVGGSIKTDMARVKERKDRVVKEASDGVLKWLQGTPNLEVIRGHARFAGPHEVEVDGKRLEAERIFINVGARATIPDIPGLSEVAYLTNSSMMDVDFLPEHLAILGGSYIALEFAQMYRRFGSEVTVIEAGERLIAREDPEVSDTIRQILETEGIRIMLRTNARSVSQRAGGIVVDTGSNRPGNEISASHLLLAVGRTPNTDDLGLDKAGIGMDSHGYIEVDEELRTSVPGVWALGDVNGRGAFTHTSYNDYEIVAANLLDGEHRKVSERIQAYALYTDPPLGRAGMTERQVRASGRKALAGKLMMARVHRARARGETQGFMSVLVDAETEKILGAAILGTEGDEVIHSILDVMYADASYTVLKRAMHIHPKVSELLP
ncbi:MAG: pyridine nucleotide-disulfide oxidoreductase family protein, partial [Noviherbaspirillum sp.]|nr:pyridine nucleotide-disulfide oxidoreductase family protein [Noviherbaspirillum sp.]